MIKLRLKYYKLTKLHQFRTYKGFLVEPTIRNFFVGRIWQRNHTPFPQPKIETYINRGFFKVVPAVRTKPKLSCRRCHNESRQKFVAFHCAKCNATCYYCRYCITMGRMCSCDELLLWQSKEKPLAQPTPNFTWSGQLTLQQAKAANELTESLAQNRNHLVSAV